ncbi:MAG TPA: hypothetical protein DEP35_01635 [Deltaproteobacteria bacterium]|nr:hypothetical protein [Deltaproteobacteria bacterium]
MASKERSARESEAKTFSLHWGSGVIEEEVQIATPYHHPTIQLLHFLDGEAKGSYEIRFCHYDHRGRFQRSPLIVDEKALPELRKALLRAPKLRRLLAKLVK